MSTDRRELRRLAAACGLSVLVGVAYVVLVARHRPLAGDELDYDTYGRLAAGGRWLWLQTPSGVPHPSAWKPPGYPAWVGLWYTLLGEHPGRVELVQTLLSPFTVVLTWALARRLTQHPRVPIAAAFVVALYPMAWQYTGLLYAEALAVPLTLAILVAGLGSEPTPRRAILVGALLGAGLLVRPSAFFLLAGVLVAWLVSAGLRRTLVAGALAVAVAAVVVAPWVLRNHHVTGTYMLSVQDAAIAGTFNPTSAGVERFPYAWLPVAPRDVDVFARARSLGEAGLRDELKARAYEYIRSHPESVPAAFFWNGLSRLWDVRRPARALDEVAFEGRSRGVAIAALVCYYPLAFLALLGLWRLRGDRAVALGLLATALAASATFTIVSGTRYRAPLEPVIAILACIGAVSLIELIRSRRDARRWPRPGARSTAPS